MTSRIDPKIIADALCGATGDGSVCDVVLLREVTSVELVYPHLWSGWSWARVWDWVSPARGYRWEHHHLRDLLRPTRRVSRLVETGLHCKTTSKRASAGVITFGPVSFGKGLPVGRYVGVRLYANTGVELGVMWFTSPLAITEPGDTIHTTSMGIEIS